MRGLMTALRRKLGLIRTTGVVEFFPDTGRADSFTWGSPSFTGTEKGVEGPYWPSMWDNLSWEAGSPPYEAVGDPSAEVWCYSI